MSNFKNVKIGDKVWDFIYGYGKVIDIENDSLYPIVVKFKNFIGLFNKNGIKINFENQTLFWDEIKFEIPKRPKIKLKKGKYLIDLNDDTIYENDKFIDYLYEEYSKENGLVRNNKALAENVLKQIKKFTRILALRDQECIYSRGYEFIKGGDNWIIKYDFAEEENNRWVTAYTDYYYFPDRIYFRTEEDAQKICDILNEGRFKI